MSVTARLQIHHCSPPFFVAEESRRERRQGARRAATCCLVIVVLEAVSVVESVSLTRQRKTHPRAGLRDAGRVKGRGGPVLFLALVLVPSLGGAYSTVACIMAQARGCFFSEPRLGRVLSGGGHAPLSESLNFPHLFCAEVVKQTQRHTHSIMRHHAHIAGLLKPCSGVALPHAYKSHKHLRARKGQEGPRPRVDSPV
jgi:hypothetical protein